MASVLETKRLVLRRFTDDDVDSLAELDSDPSVMRFITGGLATPRSEIKEEVLPDSSVTTPAGPGGASSQQTKACRGHSWAGSTCVPATETPTTKSNSDIACARTHGERATTEGARALIDYGFGRGARRVYATTMVANGASRRVMEKAGLRFVRTFTQPWPYRIDGEEKGDVEYALLRNEWEGSRGESVN
jgi:RimJ/RimL family protein N-acetyltransferase